MIGRLLPGLDDEHRLHKAYALLRRSGLAGCAVVLIGAAMRHEPAIRDDAMLCVVLGTGWVLAMLGGCLLIDVRGAVVTLRGKNGGQRDMPGMLLANLMIALSVTTAGLIATGVALDCTVAFAIMRDALG